MTKTLETVAREFAEEIKSTIVKALPVKTTNLDVRLSEKDGTGRVVLETSEPIELSCDHRPLLYLAIKYRFTLNGTHSFLKVESSSFCVLPSKSGNPLFRYEYLDAPSDSTPSAHLHVHGHRDEIVKLLYVSERSRSNRAQSSNAREKGADGPQKGQASRRTSFPSGRAALAQFDELQDKANETKREERVVQF